MDTPYSYVSSLSIWSPRVGSSPQRDLAWRTLESTSAANRHSTGYARVRRGQRKEPKLQNELAISLPLRHLRFSSSEKNDVRQGLPGRVRTRETSNNSLKDRSNFCTRNDSSRAVAALRDAAYTPKRKHKQAVPKGRHDIQLFLAAKSASTQSESGSRS